MAAWIGQMGGFLMIALIVTLAFYFINDLRIVNNSEILLIQGKNAIFVAVIGMVQLLMGALMFNYGRGAASALDLRTIWNTERLSALMSACSDGEGILFSETGMSPVFPWISSFFGKHLMEQYDATLLYVGFLGALFFGWALYLYWRECSSGKNKLSEAFLAVFFLPGAFYLFLPCGISWMLAFGMLALYFARKGNKIASIAFAVLACFFHIFGIIYLIASLVRMVKRELVNWAENAILLFGFCLCFFLNWQYGWSENWEMLCLAYPVMMKLFLWLEKDKQGLPLQFILPIMGFLNGYLMFYTITVNVIM